MMRAPRVLHLVSRYRPGESQLDAASAAMQELSPRLGHEVLVTAQHRPAVPPLPRSTLAAIHYLSDGPLGEAARQVALTGWLLRNLHRFTAVQMHDADDQAPLVAMLCKTSGRRLVEGGIPAGTPRQAAAQQLGAYGVRIPAAVAAAPDTELGCDASITDRRFHDAAVFPAGPPLLLTTIDAEEAFNWSHPFSLDARDVVSMRSQHLAHRVFSRHGVVPVYLADYPVAAQDAGRAPLRELLQDGLCDVGAQMHPWVTPPHIETINESNSFAGNLPVALELEKARCLTDTLADAFGTMPRIYRTGRYGVGPRTADILKSLGYVVDSSLAPCWPPPGRRGLPGAWASAPKPYWVDADRTLMEIPVSAALVGRMSGRSGEALAPFLFGPRARRLPIAGGMARLGLLERIRLTPEGMTVPEAKRLVRHMLAGGHRVFSLTYHSPSLEPGNTPYVRDIAQRDRFLAWLDEFYTFFREEVGGRMATWQEVRFGSGATAEQPANTLLDALP